MRVEMEARQYAEEVMHPRQFKDLCETWGFNVRGADKNLYRVSVRTFHRNIYNPNSETIHNTWADVHSLVRMDLGVGDGRAVRDIPAYQGVVALYQNKTTGQPTDLWRWIAAVTMFFGVRALAPNFEYCQDHYGRAYEPANYTGDTGTDEKIRKTLRRVGPDGGLIWDYDGAI